MKREFSAGCVVFKKFIIHNSYSGGIPHSGQFRIHFLIGKHSGYHKWVLPKGLIEKSEHGWQTALRETEEEMGVQVRLISPKAIHRVQYFYMADLKNNHSSTRRVAKYQEQGGKKTKIFKIVSFYLAEYIGGEPTKHDFEMEESGWFSFSQALKKLAFPGEKEALKKAKEMIK